MPSGSSISLGLMLMLFAADRHRQLFTVAIEDRAAIRRHIAGAGPLPGALDAERAALARLEDADLEQHQRQHEHERAEQHDQPLAGLTGPEPELPSLRMLRRDDATRRAAHSGAAEQRAGAGPGGAPRGACSAAGRVGGRWRAGADRARSGAVVGARRAADGGRRTTDGPRWWCSPAHGASPDTALTRRNWSSGCRLSIPRSSSTSPVAAIAMATVKPSTGTNSLVGGRVHPDPGGLGRQPGRRTQLGARPAQHVEPLLRRGDRVLEPVDLHLTLGEARVEDGRAEHQTRQHDGERDRESRRAAPARHERELWFGRA